MGRSIIASKELQKALPNQVDMTGFADGIENAITIALSLGQGTDKETLQRVKGSLQNIIDTAEAGLAKEDNEMWKEIEVLKLLQGCIHLECLIATAQNEGIAWQKAQYLQVANTFYTNRVKKGLESNQELAESWQFSDRLKSLGNEAKGESASSDRIAA